LFTLIAIATEQKSQSERLNHANHNQPILIIGEVSAIALVIELNADPLPIDERPVGT